jgi:hypothetical protein
MNLSPCLEDGWRSGILSLSPCVCVPWWSWIASLSPSSGGQTMNLSPCLSSQSARRNDEPVTLFLH